LTSTDKRKRKRGGGWGDRYGIENINPSREIERE